MDKVTKKRIKRYITWACMAGLVLLLTVMPLLAKNEAEKDGPQASVLSAVAEKGSITISLHGGGTLEEEDAQDAIIPTDVKITGFLVKNGDIVKAGDPVATVDKTSVMAAITSVNETMDFLREELEDGRDEKVDSAITAVPGGRVKKIFAKEGETVQEVMLRDGALAVLSIDSMMAVQFETASSLSTGTHLDVTLQDGTRVTGRVESNLDGTVVVTVEDEGYAVGQSVTVEGLGTGTLYIHNAWKATGYAGTISRVHAQEEQTLNAGGNLFTLEDREFEGQLQHRANQHRQYEKLLQELLKMYESGTIDAPCEGVVSGVDGDSVHLLAAQGEWEVALLDNSTPKYRLVFLSNTTYTCEGLTGCADSVHDPNCILSCEESDTCKAQKHKDGCPKKCSNSQSPEVDCTADVHNVTCIERCAKAKVAGKCDSQVHYTDCIQGCTQNETCKSSIHFSSCIQRCTSSPMEGKCPAETHKTSCIEKCVSAKSTGVCQADDNRHKTNCIESCILSGGKEQVCPAEVHQSGCYYGDVVYYAYVAKVFDVGSTELVVHRTAQPVQVANKSDARKLPIANMTVKDTVTSTGTFYKDDVVLILYGYKQNGNPVSYEVLLYSRSVDMSGMLNDMLAGMMGSMDLSGMMGGFSGFGSYGGAAVPETENLHDLEGSPLLTVTPHKTMKLTIALDEQVISQVTVGMPATLKVEALKNQVFSGEITDIGIHGTNNGGSSKYTASITLHAEGEMLSGMSASATIPLETRENVLLIPVAALNEVDGKLVVYTAVDRDSGEPASAVEVTTGVSDGEMVEILSGLSQGDTVYYSYYDTLEEDTSAKAEKFTFG